MIVALVVSGVVIAGVAIAIGAAFYFFKTSKEMPKNWYEWKTELRFQYIGMVGLSQDYFYKCRNKVGRFQL